MRALERKGKSIQYLRATIVLWVGNLLGALIFAGCFTYFTDILAKEPFKSGTIQLVTKEIVDQKWHVIFLRTIPCGWLVTFSMMLGAQNHDGVSKALGLRLPFFCGDGRKYAAFGQVYVSWSYGNDAGCADAGWYVLWEVFGSDHAGEYGWWCTIHGCLLVVSAYLLC